VDAGSDVVGTNCLLRPGEMLGYAVQMRQAVDAPVCCQPSAWHSWWPDATPVSPARFAEFAKEGVAKDIRFLGSCCGAGPEHVRAMAEAMGKT
jgi:methionine synthase I (cobalamin-dependent)